MKALQFLQVGNGLKPSVVMRGRQILTMTLGNVVFKDLRLYLSGALSALPKNFNFEEKLEKGFFPHLLSNCVDVFTYKSDSWPEIKL